MPIVTPEDAPTFDAGGAIITGLASPSRGSADIATWRVRFEHGHESPKHSLVDREEVFVVLSGAVTDVLVLRGNDAVIHYYGQTITLVDVQVANLSAGDFVFMDFVPS